MFNRFQGALGWGGRLAAGVCVAVLMAHTARTVNAQAPPQSAEQAGEQAPGLPIVQASTEELMAMEPVADAAASSAFDGHATDVIVATNFTAATLQETSATPPDGHIAAGPTQVIVIANGRLRSFSRSTGAKDNVLDLAPNTFFALVKAGGDVFGGRIRFDSTTNRWFITMATTAAPGRIVIAVSNAATITGSTVWNLSGFDNTAFSPGNCAIDGPTLGLDASALYLGVNQFCSGAYAGTSAFVVRKSTTFSGSSPTVTAFSNLTGTPSGAGLFAPMGVDNTDGSSTSGYFIGVDNSAYGRLVLRRVSNPGATPTLSSDISLPVAATSAPGRVRHLGNTGGSNGELSGNDDRLSSATLRGGRIWTAHAIGVNHSGDTASATRNGIRWYEIGSVDSSPAVLQSGTVFSSAVPGSLGERNYWNPSIAITSQNRAVIGFSAAGASEYANAGVAERLSTDAANTFGAPTLYTSSAAAYNPPTDAGSAQGRRWGSYSSTVTDGCDDTTVWTLQEYTNASNSYGLQVAKLAAFGPPPVPVSVSPTWVPHGRSSFDVLVHTTGSGALWSVPGGFACRLGASIPGVIVNQVTYLTATSAMVNVSTVGAIPGLKTVTITNPDGQSATSSAILTITEASSPALAVDTPAHGAIIGQDFTVSGWAVDLVAPSGPGVDAIHIYYSPIVGGVTGTASFLGVATYGAPRNDLAAALGPQFLNSGFSLSATLPPGSYRITTFAHSTVAGTFNRALANEVTVTGPVSNPHLAADAFMDGVAIQQPYQISGWAVDLGATSGSGVDAIHVWAFPVGSNQGSFAGVGNLGGARPDIAAALGAQFDNSGYNVTVSGLQPGTYTFVIYMHSAVTGTFNRAIAVQGVTVQ